MRHGPTSIFISFFWNVFNFAKPLTPEKKNSDDELLNGSTRQGCVQCMHAGAFFQIVTRGNDQVAISSKFETREDPGIDQLLRLRNVN